MTSTKLLSFVLLSLFAVAFAAPSPIVLQVARHERQLFDWHPEFTLNVPSFDSHNRPYIRSRTDNVNETSFIHTFRHGKWLKYPFIEALKVAFPDFAGTVKGGGWFTSRIVFDVDDHAYTLLQIQLKDHTKKNLLLYSRDYCATWEVYELPGGTFSIEHWTGHNEIQGPPAICLLIKYAEHPARWASRMRLHLVFPKKTLQGLKIGDPVFVTNDCLGVSQHSGGASFMATKEGKTHLVWAEVTDEKAAGSPTFVATYDHKMKKLVDKILLAYAPPVNDVHNTPGICFDSEGYLHVITGAHGENFYYLRSRRANDVYAGWTEPEATLTGGWVEKDGKQRGRQTYLAFVCDKDHTLHIVFREWRRGVDPYHNGGYYAAMSYQRKSRRGKWEAARPLVVSPLPKYSIFYHKFGMDRLCRLYLSYSYWSFSEPYKSLKGIYRFRSMLFSGRRGDTWDLVTTEDFVEGMKAEPM